MRTLIAFMRTLIAFMRTLIACMRTLIAITRTLIAMMRPLTTSAPGLPVPTLNRSNDESKTVCGAMR